MIFRSEDRIGTRGVRVIPIDRRSEHEVRAKGGQWLMRSTVPKLKIRVSCTSKADEPVPVAVG